MKTAAATGLGIAKVKLKKAGHCKSCQSRDGRQRDPARAFLRDSYEAKQAGTKIKEEPKEVAKQISPRVGGNLNKIVLQVPRFGKLPSRFLRNTLGNSWENLLRAHAEPRMLANHLVPGFPQDNPAGSRREIGISQTHSHAVVNQSGRGNGDQNNWNQDVQRSVSASSETAHNPTRRAPDAPV